MSTPTQTLTATDELFINQRATSKEEIAALITHMRAMEASVADFIVPSKDLVLDVVDGEVKATFPTGGGLLNTPVAYGIRSHAHGQIAAAAEVPVAYYRKCVQDAPDLACENINRWLPGTERYRYVRTLGGQVRAVLSDQYKVLDGVDLFFNAFQGAKERGGEIVEIRLSETRFYIELAAPNMQERVEYLRANRDVAVTSNEPDFLIPYVVASTSEVGLGGLNVEVGVRRLVCRNGMIGSKVIAKIHRGERQNVGFISAETRRAAARLAYLEVRDAVTAAFDADKFRTLVANINESTGMTVDEPVKTVEKIAEHFGLTDGERDAFMSEFMSPATAINPGPTVWGLTNAMTFIANETDDPNRRYELQRFGGEILERRHDRQLVAVR